MGGLIQDTVVTQLPENTQTITGTPTSDTIIDDMTFHYMLGYLLGGTLTAIYGMCICIQRYQYHNYNPKQISSLEMSLPTPIEPSIPYTSSQS